MKINWLDKIILKLFPTWGMKRLARKGGVENMVFDKLHEVLTGVDRVDIQPFMSGTRGFVLVLDRETALYFQQDGDKFVYEGYEMGKFEGGDVTVFDELR